MIEFFRSFAQRHGLTLWAPRRERRLTAEMEVALMKSPGAGGAGPCVLAYGRTTDLSAGGVGVVIDSLSGLHSYRAVGDAPEVLRITGEKCALMMEVEPRSYNKLEGTPCRFAVGLRITNMSGGVREEYTSHLKALELKGRKIGGPLLTQHAPSLPLAG